MPAADAGDEFTPELDDLMVGLSQVLFPIVLLLGLNGLFVGILNAYDHFTIPALAPLVWNFVIIGVLVALKPYFEGPNEMYAYAIGVLVGDVRAAVMCLPVLRRLDFVFELKVNFRDPRVRQVLALMLPITLSLGLINFNLFINSALGSTVSDAVPRAIDAAFRLYMLPQGMFSVAVATVLFPALARLATRGDTDGLRALTGTGTRQICLLLIPAAACTLVLAEPITRVVYQRGEFGTGLDGHRRRGAVLVLLQPALRGRQPPAHADVLLAAAALAADRPGRGDARHQPRRRAAARRPVRNRGHRRGDRGRQRLDDRRPGVLPAPRAGRSAGGLRHDARGGADPRRVDPAGVVGYVAWWGSTRSSVARCRRRSSRSAVG